jgi:hypothetical protein
MTITQEMYSEGTHAAASWSVGEISAGIVVIVLTILGLAGVVPNLLVAIATIAAGVDLVLRGNLVASELASLLLKTEDRELERGGEVWAIEIVAGAAGVVLGILALLRVAPVDLVAIAIIAFGGAFVVTSSLAPQIVALKLSDQHKNEQARRAVAGIMSGSTGVQALVGLQAIVLGILALAGFNPVVLVLVALLALGSFAFLNSPGFSAGMLGLFRR